MTGLAVVRKEFQTMDAASGNERRPTVARRCAGTVMLTNVGADGQVDPADPGMTEPDRPAHEKQSQRLYKVDAFRCIRNQ